MKLSDLMQASELVHTINEIEDEIMDLTKVAETNLSKQFYFCAFLEPDESIAIMVSQRAAVLSSLEIAKNERVIKLRKLGVEYDEGD